MYDDAMNRAQATLVNFHHRRSLLTGLRNPVGTRYLTNKVIHSIQYALFNAF